MPIHTPSPHRFLAPTVPSSQKRRPKPPSALGNVQTPGQTPSAHRSLNDGEEQRKATPAKRFVFGTPASRRIEAAGEDTRGGNAAEGTWQTHTPRPRAPKLSKVDSIDTASPTSSANAEIVPSIEENSRPQTAGQPINDDDEILFLSEERNKRRRVSSLPPSSPTDARSHDRTSHQKQHAPHTPAQPSHRFRISAPLLDDTTTPAHDRPSTSRPHFILPHGSPSPSKAGAPLPEIFSPSRKSGKFVPNGMASTMQTWIIEAANAEYSGQSTPAAVWARDREEGVKLKFKITGITSGRSSEEGEAECWQGGVVLVRGTTDGSSYNASRSSSLSRDGVDRTEDTEIKVMLAGRGSFKGKGSVRIRHGTAVGVKAPLWKVDVGVGEQAQKWVVGVEWVVLL